MISHQTDSKAILIHHNSKSRTLAMISHDVVKTDRGFTLGAGTLFSEQDKDKLVSIINDCAESGGWVNSNILYQSPTKTIWYSTGKIRDIRFSDKDNSIVKAPYPNQVFMYSQGTLYAFAYKGKSRPNRNTALYYTPFPNVYAKGNICSGNISFPKISNVENIPEWEEFFFEGVNTHTGNVKVAKVMDDQDDTDSLIQLWKSLEDSGAKVFPSKQLLSAGYDLNCLERF